MFSTVILAQTKRNTEADNTRMLSLMPQFTCENLKQMKISLEIGSNILHGN